MAYLTLHIILWSVVALKADEEMKREQERRVTEDKKNSVQQQLLHTVCYNDHTLPSELSHVNFPTVKISVAQRHNVMC